MPRHTTLMSPRAHHYDTRHVMLLIRHAAAAACCRHMPRHYATHQRATSVFTLRYFRQSVMRHAPRVYDVERRAFLHDALF